MRKFSISLLFQVAFLFAGLHPAALAQLDHTGKVEKLYAEGASYFKEGHYQMALDKFKEAYRLFQEPNLLYNIARCYEALGKVDLAIDSYQAFVGNPSIDQATKNKAETKLRDLLEAKASANIPTEGAVAGTAPSTSPYPASTSARTKKTSAITSYHPWTWITLAVGSALVLSGAIALLLGESDHRTVTNADNYKTDGIASLTRMEAQSLMDSGDSKKTVGYILCGVGAGALVSSGVLFLLDRQNRPTEKPRSATKVGLSPLPGGGSLSFHGAF